MSTTSANTLLLCETALIRASFSRSPITPLQVNVKLVDTSTPLSSLPKPVFLDVFSSIQRLVEKLKQELGIHRFGLVSEGKSTISLVPMHGIDAGAKWKPIIPEDFLFFGKSSPGYICTKNGRKMSERELDEVRDALSAISGLHEEDIGKYLIGEHDPENLFARLIIEDIPCWKYHDTADHVAFLTPFPNTTGYSCVITKRHYSSDILTMPQESYRELLATSLDVAPQMKIAFNVEHVGFMIEGYGVNHAHLKIVPIFEQPQTVGDPGTAWFERYEGYLTSQKGDQLKEGQRMDKLNELASSLSKRFSNL